MTTPQARLYKKSEGNKAHLCYLNHVLMENRNGLIVDVMTTQPTGTAEREAALAMAERTIGKPGATLGADKNYDVADFVAKLRKQKITPHVAQKKKSAIDDRTTRHKGYAQSIKKRKLVEESFGWAKTVGGLRKARFVGLAKLKMLALFTFAAFNLTRITSLLGWPLSDVPRPKSA